jgi:hypothetical protein
MVPGQAYAQHHGYQSPSVYGAFPYTYSGQQYPGGLYSGGYAPQIPFPSPFQIPLQSPQMMGPQTGIFAGGINVPHVPPQPNGTGVLGWNPRMPQPIPRIDPTMPAAQMTNSSGGTGCEPGYNYFFPAEHTKIHVFACGTAPWQLPPNVSIQFKAAHVPCSTTCSEILKGYGATNPNPKKNKCFEIVQGGNGRWYKGLCISGDDKDMLKKPIKDLGWDSSRTGQPGQKPVVCLWLTKD